MSRNRCSDKCDCGYLITLKELVGQPVEFRKYGPYTPQMGTKWICKQCNKVYFVWLRMADGFWCKPEHSEYDGCLYPDGRIQENKDKGKYVFRPAPGEKLQQTGTYQIDSSYYESYNDEGEGIDTPDPWCLCTEDDFNCRVMN